MEGLPRDNTALTTIWNAAYYLQKRSKNKYPIHHRLNFTDVSLLHTQLENAQSEMNLRVLARLLVGITLIHKIKCTDVYVKASRLLSSIHKEISTKNNKNIDLPVSETKLAQITLSDNPYFLDDEWLFTINNTIQQVFNSSLTTTLNSDLHHFMISNESSERLFSNNENTSPYDHQYINNNDIQLYTINNNNNYSGENGAIHAITSHQQTAIESTTNIRQSSIVNMNEPIYIEASSFPNEPFDSISDHEYYHPSPSYNDNNNISESTIPVVDPIEHSNALDNKDFRFNDRSSMQSEEFHFPFESFNRHINIPSTFNPTLHIPLLRQRRRANLMQENNNNLNNVQQNIITQNMISPHLPPPPESSPPNNWQIQDTIHQQEQNIHITLHQLNHTDNINNTINNSQSSRSFINIADDALIHNSIISDDYSQIIQMSLTSNDEEGNNTQPQKKLRNWVNQQESMTLSPRDYLNTATIVNRNNSISDFQPTDRHFTPPRTTSVLKRMLEDWRNHYRQPAIQSNIPFVVQHFQNHRQNNQIVNQLGAYKHVKQQLYEDAVVPRHITEGGIERGLMDMNQQQRQQQEGPMIMDMNTSGESSSLASRNESRRNSNGSESRHTTPSVINVPLQDDNRLGFHFSSQDHSQQQEESQRLTFSNEAILDHHRHSFSSSFSSIHNSIDTNKFENILDIDQLLQMDVDIEPVNPIPDTLTIQLKDFLSYLQLFTSDQQPAFIFQEVLFSAIGENKRSDVALAFNYILVLAQKNKLKLEQSHPYGLIRVTLF
ncbi:hypothetical protein BJ944DRAFT_274643 [Cunninghamella echinulata]|nr:hypothetical protein BJ944DRAFT_274643 [Cunninghamella echinulata]